MLAPAARDDILIPRSGIRIWKPDSTCVGRSCKVSTQLGMHLDTMDMDSSYGDDTIIVKIKFLLCFGTADRGRQSGRKDTNPSLTAVQLILMLIICAAVATRKMPTLRTYTEQLMLQGRAEAK